MSSGPGGDHRNDYSNFATFDPTGSNLPPPLRPPALSTSQVLAAVKLGFSDKPSSNGRGGGHNNVNNTDPSGFPQIGTFSIEDCVDGGGGGGQGYQQQQQQEEQEGLTPPLRRPHVNEIPPGN